MANSFPSKKTLPQLLFLVFISLTNFSKIFAHPVAFKGSHSIMLQSNSKMSEWMYTYTLLPQFSLSTHYTKIEIENKSKSYLIPHANFLVKRWNELGSQANIYFSVGSGWQLAPTKGFQRESINTLSLETDWESRKWYSSYKYEILSFRHSTIKQITNQKLRLGFAPYLAEFNEMNSWFIVQLDKKSNEKSLTTTPLLRLFYKNVLTEIGINNKGMAQFNLMIHY